MDREPRIVEGLEKFMQKYRSYLGCLALVIGMSQGVWAQASQTAVPLPSLINQLQTEQGLAFSYDPTLLGYFSVVSPSADLPKEDFYAALQALVPFRFEIVDDKNILISPRPVDFTFHLQEEDTQLPLPGGYVKQNGQYLPVTGDADGAIRFRLDWSPQDTLEFNFVGFEAHKVPLLEAMQSANRTVQMQLSTTVLAPVVVQSYLGAGISAFQQNQRLELRPDEMGILPGDADKDLLVSLRNLPGIHTPTGLAGDLRIRGGTPDMTLILFNNIPIFHRGYYYGTISPFNTDMVDRVRVYRNGYGPELGGRVGGAVEIQSEAKVTDDWQAGVSGNAVAASAYVKAPIIKNKLGLQVAARAAYPGMYTPLVERRYNELILSATPLEARSLSPNLVAQPFQFNYQDANGAITFTPRPGTTIHLDGLAIFNENISPQLELTDSIYKEDIDKIYNTGFNLAWDQHWGAWKGNTFVSFSDFQSHTFSGVRLLQREELNLTYNGRINSITSWRARTSWGRVLSDLQDEVSFGYVWNQHVSNNIVYDSTESTPNGSSRQLKNGGGFQTSSDSPRRPRPRPGDMPTPPNDDRPVRPGSDVLSGVHSLFVQYSHPSWHRLAFDVGGRLSYFQATQDFRLEPRLFLNYSLTDQWILKGSAGSYSQYLANDIAFAYNNLDENTYAWNALRGGNRGRSMIRGTQGQLGVLWQNAQWLFDIEGYWKQANGLTASLNLDEDTGLELLDGELRSRGIDMLVRTTQGPFDLWASYTLSFTEHQFDGLAIGWFPALYDQRHLINLSGVAHWGGLRASLGWYLNSGVPNYSEDGPYPDFQEFSGSEDIVPQAWTDVRRSGWTHQLDASIRYAFTRGPLRTTLGISVLNAYNQENILNINKVYGSPMSDESTLLPQTLIGFTPNFMVKVEYAK